MQQEKWADRWRSGQIAFHQAAPNELLVRHADAFAGRRRVYVPLCGKSLDLLWFFERGHDVVGSEFVGDAVAAFFAEHEAALEGRPTSVRMGDVVLHEVAGLRVVQGDAFGLDTAALGGRVDAIWDRAALVAIDPDRRDDYAKALRRVLADDGVIVLVTITYDQSTGPGPPWSVDAAEVERVFGSTFAIESGIIHPNGPDARGRSEQVFFLRPRPHATDAK
jgi:thiopurine S-methyltransferase